MSRKRKRSANRIVSQLLFQSALVVLVALGSFMLMTWLIADVFDVEHTYAAAAFELAGTLVVLVLALVPLNTVLYHRRLSEIEVLSQAIRRVSEGNYTSKIPTAGRSQITPVYEAFNKMCAELESVQLLRNDFINGYSHEFKTPIASINGFATLLLEKELPPEKQREFLGIIADESARLSELAASSILFSRLSAQQIVTDKEVYDLGEQLRQCSIILSKKWMEKRIDFSGDICTVMWRGNKDMMQHLWLNLLDNAVKYTPPGGEIRVKNFVKDTHIIVEVSDTGCGIPEETLRRMFVPYFQGDQSRSQQGLGLGLAISRRIAELCGGTISAKSEEGNGTTFTVVLPR